MPTLLASVYRMNGNLTAYSLPPWCRRSCQSPPLKTGKASPLTSSISGTSPTALGPSMANVVIRAPVNSGSLFFNYKGTHSVVLLAVVDAQYCFRVVDVGSYGRTSDGGALANSTFGQALRDGTLGLPQDALLPGAEHLRPQPHVFVADEAFPLRRDLMRPFQDTISPAGKGFSITGCPRGKAEC